MKQQKYIRYILLPTTLLCLIASLFCGCSANSGKISKTGFYFDTMITVTLYGTRDEKILDDCFSLAGNYEKKLSNTITDSEVSKINEANGQFVTVSSDTLSLIKDGIRYGKISDGSFDITIGTLSDLWNFSEIAETAKSDENEVDASVVPVMKRYWMIAFPWQETTKRNFQTPSQTVKFQRLTRQTASL